MAADIEHMLCRLFTGASVPAARLDELWAHATVTDGVEVLAQALVASGRYVHTATHQRAVIAMRDAALVEMLRRRVLRRLVDTFDQSETPMLLIKGAGLAYTVYSQPYLRPARDIDLFINRENLDAAEAALALAGFARVLEPDTEAASMQRHYRWRDVYGVDYFVDLHWRIADRHVFAEALSFSDAWEQSQLVACLGRSARTLGTQHALLLACIHRIAHHNDDPDRLWLWDIHLLTTRLDSVDVDALAVIAARSGMRAVVVRGLELARDRFGTAISPSLLAELGKGDVVERSASLIDRNPRHVDFVLSDLAAVSARTRARLIREHLFPGVSYMRAKYPTCPGPLLPLAYLYRIARGAPKWFDHSS